MNELELLGDNGLATAGSGKTITVSGVNATAGATALLATVGVASFDSAAFTVTDGFVELNSMASSIGITKFVVDPVVGETMYSTIQTAIDAAVADGIDAAIYIRPGTYTEDLTLYDGIQLVAATGLSDTDVGVTIVGKHLPPASGAIVLKGVKLESATHIFDSAVAGTTSIILSDCGIEVTNGFTFNLPNWTGTLIGFDLGATGTQDGFINNTGGSAIFLTDATIGAGSTNTMVISGNTEIFNVAIKIPMTIQGTAVTTISGGTDLKGTLTTADTADLTISHSYFSTGATSAIIHTSTTTLELIESSIDSSNANAIDGTGTINATSVTFIDSDTIAATITQEEGSHLSTPEITANNIERMKFTGFHSWTGAGSYYSVTGVAFTVDRPGVGYIKGRRIEWLGAQTVAGLTAGACHLIYIDETGTIGSTTSFIESVYESYIPLFEALVDPTGTSITIVVKENHPYSAPTDLSMFLHRAVGVVIADINLGANLIAVAATDEVGISGEDFLEDHGLETTIPDSAGVGETWNVFFTNGAGKWSLDSTVAALPSEYNNAGTMTALGAGKFGVYTMYASKDDIETAIPMYISIADDAEYSNLTQAKTAIANRDVSIATNELLDLELARLGYVIYSQATASVVYIQIDKATIRGSTVINGATTANLITVDTTDLDGILSSSDTTVQSALETIDDFGKDLTDHAVVVGNGNGSALGVITVGSTGEVMTGVTGADPAFSSTPTVTSITATSLYTANLDAGMTIAGNQITADGVDTNIDLYITPKGTGSAILSKVDINGGAIDGTTIGATTKATVGSTAVTVDPGASGDSFVQFDINTTSEFKIGVDDDDADKFKISQGSALGTNDTFIVTADGEVTQPLQPYVLAYLASTESNVTGDATQAIIGAVSGWTEYQDIGSDFSGYTFTSPVDGSYLMCASTIAVSLGSGHTNSNFQIVTSDNQYIGGVCSPGASRSSGNKASFYMSHIAQMDAGDTCVLKLAISNSTKTVGIDGTSSTYLSIQLLA